MLKLYSPYSEVNGDMIDTNGSNRHSTQVIKGSKLKSGICMNGEEQKRTILYADDDAISRKIIINFLCRNGYCVITANTGCDAVVTFQKEHIDLILMDVRMPEMDGFTAVGMIREYEKSRSRHVPIIAVTACAIIGDREKCIEAGMDDYISKPIDLMKLLELVSKWLK